MSVGLQMLAEPERPVSVDDQSSYSSLFLPPTPKKKQDIHKQHLSTTIHTDSSKYNIDKSELTIQKEIGSGVISSFIDYNIEVTIYVRNLVLFGKQRKSPSFIYFLLQGKWSPFYRSFSYMKARCLQ